MIEIDQKKRLINTLDFILKYKINLDIPEKLIEYIDSIEYENIDLHTNKKIKKYNFELKNYDDLILNSINKKLNKKYRLADILHKTYSIENIDVPRELNMILDNKFISIRIKREILNNLNFVTNYKYEKRQITIISDNYECDILDDIISILNLFDSITKKKK